MYINSACRRAVVSQDKPSNCSYILCTPLRFHSPDIPKPCLFGAGNQELQRRGDVKDTLALQSELAIQAQMDQSIVYQTAILTLQL
jgi:hypothetical protein